MTDKKNCWEVMACGRGPGRSNGNVCPAAKEIRLNGIHGGLNGGRGCWVVAGTLCKGDVSGTFAKKMEDCFQCSFYRQVRGEESSVTPHQELLIRISKT